MMPAITFKPVLTTKLTDTYREESRVLFKLCEIKHDIIGPLDSACSRAVNVEDRYMDVGEKLGIPWWFIACVHALETSQRFTLHLHNGDPLTGRTVRVPKGRPINGTPPFTWEESAVDALRLQRLHQWADWTVAGVLFQFERYNGFGYRRRGVFSPYVWSGSQFYAKGKYVADGKFDPEAVSKQIGCAVILKHLVNVGIVAVSGV